MSRLLALILLVPNVALAWGFNGHRRLASHLAEPFPAGSCLGGWLSTVTQSYTWQNKACDPDRWRTNDPTEGPRHYLDIDYAYPIASYPRVWSEVVNRFGAYADDNGQVPWRVEEYYGILVADLAMGDGPKALDSVAFLSHYVTDAFSPLHDTKNQPNDLHSRYESDLLAVTSQIDAISQLSRSYRGVVGAADPLNQIFDVVIVGQPLAQQLIADDAAASGDMTALYNNTQELTARRWGDAVTLMASLIGSAWVEAGRPMLAGMTPGCSNAVPQGQMLLAGYPLPGQPPLDGGTGYDAGVAVDAGVDAGVADAGTKVDAGTIADAGVEVDGGSSEEDGGLVQDGGQDAGRPSGGGGSGIGVGNWTPPPPEPQPSAGGCSCDAAAVPALLPILMLGAVLAARRRRS